VPGRVHRYLLVNVIPLHTDAEKYIFGIMDTLTRNAKVDASVMATRMVFVLLTMIIAPRLQSIDALVLIRFVRCQVEAVFAALEYKNFKSKPLYIPESHQLK